MERNTFKFVHFGCWNNMNNINKDNGQPEFFNVANNITMSNNDNYYDAMFIAGDNYYSHKKVVNGKKEKTYKKSDLIKGFDKLKEIEIPKKYVLWGNHDLEYLISKLEDNNSVRNNNENNNENNNNNNNSNFMKGSNIVNTQIQIVRENSESMEFNNLGFNRSGSNEERNMTKPVFHLYNKEKKTLFVMLDTTLLCKFDEETIAQAIFMPYYRGITYNNSDGNKKTIHTTKDYIEYTIFRFKLLLDSINRADRRQIKNIVLIGHHPLLFLRTKIKNGKQKPGYLPFKEEGLINIFAELIKVMNAKLNTKYTLNYLCADFHLYMKATLEIAGKELTQYICGTGGTVLDDLTIEDFNKFNKQPVSKTNYNLICQEYVLDYGFLDCLINNNNDIKFTFRSMTKPIIKNKKKLTTKNNLNTYQSKLTRQTVLGRLFSKGTRKVKPSRSMLSKKKTTRKQTRKIKTTNK